MNFDKVIESRRSIRKYKNKTVKYSKILEAIDAACQAPFAGNINNLKFIIIHSQDTKNKLAGCCAQDWIAFASHVVVVCSQEKHLKSMYGDDCKTYGKHHAGAAIENFLLKIAEQKLSSCWVGAFIEKDIKRALKIPEDYAVEALLPVGVADEKPHPPRKCSLERAIYWEKWNQTKKPTLVKDPPSI